MSAATAAVKQDGSAINLKVQNPVDIIRMPHFRPIYNKYSSQLNARPRNSKNDRYCSNMIIGPPKTPHVTFAAAPKPF